MNVCNDSATDEPYNMLHGLSAKEVASTIISQIEPFMHTKPQLGGCEGEVSLSMEDLTDSEKNPLGQAARKFVGRRLVKCMMHVKVTRNSGL